MDRMEPLILGLPKSRTLSEETIGRAVSIEGEFPMQCLQDSVSRLPTVDIDPAITGGFMSLKKL
jgi:hypothetical protein